MDRLVTAMGGRAWIGRSKSNAAAAACRCRHRRGDQSHRIHSRHGGPVGRDCIASVAHVPGEFGSAGSRISTNSRAETIGCRCCTSPSCRALPRIRFRRARVRQTDVPAANVLKTVEATAMNNNGAKKTGAVLVQGAALPRPGRSRLANSGFKVYLSNRCRDRRHDGAPGQDLPDGRLRHLHRSPNSSSAPESERRDLTLSELVGLEGETRSLKASVRRYPRYVERTNARFAANAPGLSRGHTR